jgi:hypothetical protein
MLAGIELKAAGKKIGWSVDEYLRTLEETVLEAIQEQARKDTGRSQEQTQPNNEQKDSGENDGKSG